LCDSVKGDRPTTGLEVGYSGSDGRCTRSSVVVNGDVYARGRCRLTRGVDAVKDVFDGCGGEGGAAVPSKFKAVIGWCTSPGVEEVCGEASKVRADEPSSEKSSSTRRIKQWEAS